MSELPTGTLTLLFTDIDGSTRLLQALGDQYPDVLATHRDLLRQAFRRHGGTEVDTQGDAFFVVFARASQGVAAAVEAQRALADHSWPRDRAVRARMGLHTGEPQRTAEGYAGIDLHRAARICAAGHGGQILLSEVTAAAARQALPDGLRLHDLGPHRLRDLPQPEHLYQLDVLGLPANFPAVRSLDARPNNLPTPPTPLLGREREIERIVGLLRREDVRLVTLTGAGGSGKTRLALQVATDLLHDFADGAFFVALAPIADPVFVVPTIAQALGVQEGGGRPLLETVKDELRMKHRLLVLDNFEQLLPASPQVGELLAACPELKFLVTSRAALHLSGEHEAAVPPLGLPARRPPRPAEDLSQYPAVKLFIERVTAVRAEFVITNANAPAVAEICHRLDGLPLAIELAAARSKVLTPEAILARLERPLSLLTGGPRDLPARQQALRATIAWSYDLLDGAEQALFRRLAVFVGGCTLDAAEAVCSLAGSQELSVLDGITALVDQSLLVSEERPDGEPRIRTLETIREFALEQLEASGEGGALRRQHAAFFLALAESAVPYLQSGERAAWLTRLDAEVDNLRAALTWSGTDTGDIETGLRLIGALNWFWFCRDHSSEARRWAEAILALPASAKYATARANALHTAGSHAWQLGDAAASRAWLAESIAAYQDLDNFTGAAWPLLHFGLLALDGGDAATARIQAVAALERFRAANDQWAESIALFTLGDATVSIDPVAARTLYEESLSVARATGDTWIVAMPLTSLGHLAVQEGDYATARGLLEEGLAIRRHWDNHWELTIALASLAEAVRCQGDTSYAAALCEESIGLSRQLGDEQRLAWALHNRGQVALAEQAAQEAGVLLGESLELRQANANLAGVAASLAALAGVAAHQQAWNRAAQLLGAAASLLDQTDTHLEPADQIAYANTAAAARAALGAEAFDLAQATGRSFSPEQAGTLAAGR